MAAALQPVVVSALPIKLDQLLLLYIGVRFRFIHQPVERIYLALHGGDLVQYWLQVTVHMLLYKLFTWPSSSRGLVDVRMLTPQFERVIYFV
jgi:hypothetical protein